MGFEDRMAAMWEAETDRLIDEMYREEPEVDADYEPNFDEVDLYELRQA